MNSPYDIPLDVDPADLAAWTAANARAAEEYAYRCSHMRCGACGLPEGPRHDCRT